MAGYKLVPDTLETDKIFGRLDKSLDGPDAQKNIQEVFSDLNLEDTQITRSRRSIASLITGRKDTITITDKNTKAQVSIRIDRPSALSRAKPKVSIEPTDLEESAPNMQLAARIAAKFAAPVSTSDISKEALQKEREQQKSKEIKKAQTAELEKTRALKEVSGKEHSALETTMRDRSVANQKDFTNKEAKSDGLAAGYVGTEDASDHDFMLKQFYKTTELANQKPPEEKREQAQKDRRDGVRELIGSTLYQFLLYDSAPKEQLVIPDAQHQDSLYVRSKFFNDSQALLDWKKSNDPSKLEGFERAIAACHILGEADYHQNNLMVETVDGEAKVKKIDHGRSFIVPIKDFEQTMRNTFVTFGTFRYLKRPNPTNFNVTKYSESLNQMLEQLTPEQADQIVDQKIDELKKAGFDPAGLTLDSYTDDNAPAEKTISSFEDLRTTMQESIHSNLERMRDVAAKVEVITKFGPPEKVSQKFKDGRWLKEFATTETTDPVLYAVKKDLTIEGLAPMVWAQQNNYKIKSSAQTIEHEASEPQHPQEEAKTQEQKPKATIKEQYSTGTSPQQYLQDHPEIQATPETKELIEKSEVKKSPLEIKTELIVMVFDKDLEKKLPQPEVQELQKLVTKIPNNSSIEKFTKHMQAIKTWIASKSGLLPEVKSKLDAIASAKPVDKSQSTRDINKAIKARDARRSGDLAR